MQTEELETIRICLEQRTIFMTSIYNVTKQLQVKATQEEILFGDLLDARQEYMNRIDRCNALIKGKSQELDSDNRERIQSILEGAKPDGLSEDYTVMVELVAEYNELLEQTKLVDAQAVQLVKEKHTDLKDRINTIRQKRADAK